jgi:phosphohistidine swiveling domain-containing protein
VETADLPVAVERVRASGASTGVAAYAAGRRAGLAASDVAVLIQPMVRATVAGVAFSADPLSGDRDTVVVNGIRGTGEALLSGRMGGDEWTIRDGRATHRRGTSSALTAELVEAVADLAHRVAAVSNRPQDIEWVHDGRHLWLLQARPITGLPDAVSWNPGAAGLFSRNFRFGEWISEPVTPLFESWLLTSMEERLHWLHLDQFGMRAPYPRHVVVNGWYFYSLNFLPVSLAALRRSLPTLLAKLVREPRRASLWMGPFARFGAPTVEREWREELAPRYASAVREAEATVDTAEPAELVALIDRLAALAGEYFASITVVAGSAYKAEMELARFYQKHLAPMIGGTHLSLLAGLTAPTPLPHHAVTTIDWWHATRGELDRGTGTRAPDNHDELVARREVAEAAARTALRRSPRRGRAFERLLSDAQRPARAREEQVPSFTRPWPVLRLAVLRLGGALTAAGVIDEPDDVFFVTRQEVVEAITQGEGSWVGAVAARRLARERAARLVPPMTVGQAPFLVRKLVLEGRSLVGAKPPGSRTLLVGVPASPGRISGRVRVVHDPDAAALQPGEVLVAPLTAPAWTPLFATAAAVVTDVGSALAHASVIAREYGIPAVVGCGDATSRLKDGQLVTVDGGAGLIEDAAGVSDAPSSSGGVVASDLF